MSDWFLTWATDARGTHRAAWFAFDVPIPFWSAWVLLAVVFATGLFFWSRRSGWLLASLRSSALALALFLALGPVLVARRLEPGTHFVPVLFDDSLSMSVTDGDGSVRSERLRRAYAASGFEASLQQSHQISRFRFGARADRVAGVDALAFAQTESDILGAIGDVRQHLANVSVSALVMLTDGAQQPVIDRQIEALPTDVPVFTVGVGRADGWRDLALDDLSVSRTHFDRSPVAVTARIRAEGLAGQTVFADVLDGTRTVASSSFEVVDEDIENSVRLTFSPQSDDWRVYQMRVRLANGADPIVENNVRAFAVDNRAQAYRILYFAGRPNWQNKFVRRALDDAPQLALSSLVRISGAERKFVFRGRDEASLSNPLFEGYDDLALNTPRYDEAVFIRIGVGASELASGYPSEAEELFRYHLVILGEIERGFFSQAQLDLTRDFVSKRGGSLLMLGGPKAFAGWRGSVMEPMLPVVLGRDDSFGRTQAQVLPRIEGVLSGIWTLDADPAVNADKWGALPPLFSANRFEMTRPGATTLASWKADEEAPLFVWQRYGEGLSAVLATGETWQWQTMTSAGDVSHARFWRQLARSLVTQAPNPVSLMDGGRDVVVGDAHALKFVVRDSLFDLREGLVVDVQTEEPNGASIRLPVEESMDDPGGYAAEFLPDRAGLHQMSLTARDADGVEIARYETAVLAQPDHREFQSPRYDPDFLRRIAEHTGGAFFELDELDELAARIPLMDTQNAVLDRLPLWPFPPFYGLLVVLLSVEWYVRRKRGHP